MDKTYPTSNGDVCHIQKGQWISHMNRFGNPTSSIVHNLNKDGFETREYSCGNWDTKNYSYESVIEIIHDGVEFTKWASDTDALQANIRKEFLQKVDKSREYRVEIGTEVQIFPHSKKPDAKIVNIYQVQTCRELQTMYIVERLDMKSREHLLRSQFIVHGWREAFLNGAHSR